MSKLLRALLVDDEPPALERLHQLLRLCGDVEVVAMVCSVREAIAALQLHPIDLLFLDEQMPGGDGHTLLNQIPNGVEVIFITAHCDYAVEAFAAGVHDYLLKPVQAARLELSLERLRQRRGYGAGSPDENSSGLWLEAGDGERGVSQFVPFAEILWVAAMQNYTHLQLQDRPGLVVKRPIKHWEERLPSEQFLRLDRSTIVQPSLISRCERQSRSCTLLRFGRTAEAPTLAVGSTAAIRLQKALATQP
jgi:two-component system LytT family response regulator